MTHDELQGFTRRAWLKSGGALSALAAGGLIGSHGSIADDLTRPRSAKGSAGSHPFGFCFNTSTFRGQKLDLARQIEAIADAGYTAAELWVRDIQDFARRGGSVTDLAKRIRDLGLVLPSTISFFPWLCEDAAERARGLEQAKREMDLVRRVGATRIAAPPVGLNREDRLDLLKAAARYRALLDAGASIGVTPQFELWGFSNRLSRVGECACVAMESGHPQACLLLDVYHIYKGGSSFETLRFLSGESMHVLHMNDYPASPPRASITDADRVFPGDGVAPFGQILRALRDLGFRGFLSLELFNRNYWKQDPHLVARTGLRKMQQCVQAALD